MCKVKDLPNPPSQSILPQMSVCLLLTYRRPAHLDLFPKLSPLLAIDIVPLRPRLLLTFCIEVKKGLLVGAD